MQRISAIAIVAFGFASLFQAPAAIAQTSGAVAPPWRGPGDQAPAVIEPDVFSIFPTEGWTSRTAMPAGRWAHAMAAYTVGAYPTNNVFIFVISGGDTGFANTGVLSRYDVALDSWSDLAPMSPARMQISAARVGNKIYVPGGYAGSFSPTTTLSVYDIVTGQWGVGASLPQATGDYAFGVYADRYLYVIGGYSGSGDLNNVQVYDTVADSWQSATAKPGSAVAGLRGGIVGNQIIVVGGYSQSLASELADAYVGTIDNADPTVIVWTPIAAYPGGTVGRLGAGVPLAVGPAQGAAGLNFVMFTAGDPNGQGTSVKSDTWIYDFNDAAWKSGPAKPTGVSNICNIAGVSSGGRLHIVSTGGYDGSSVTAVNEWLTFGEEAPPDLALTATASSNVFDANSSLAYTLDYTVGTPGNAENVSISDTVPVGAVFDAGASSPGWVCTPDVKPGSVCVMALGTLAEGTAGSVSFVIDTLTPPADNFQIDNQASISTVARFGPEQNLSNNTASVSTPYSTRIFADDFEGP